MHAAKKQIISIGEPESKTEIAIISVKILSLRVTTASRLEKTLDTTKNDPRRIYISLLSSIDIFDGIISEICLAISNGISSERIFLSDDMIKPTESITVEKRTVLTHLYIHHSFLISKEIITKQETAKR